MGDATTTWIQDALESSTEFLLTTATTTAAAALSTAFDFDDDSAISAGLNTTIPDVNEPAPYNEGNYVVNAIIGLLIVLASSVLNAGGLNLTKLDHQQQQAIPKRNRKKEYLRPLWLAGMGIYIASQVFGSPLALRYLRPDWVAPLGASSLVFNFLFAYWLVGTPVTTSDIRGTALIVLGVILIVVFSSINHGLRQDLPIDELNRLWSRGAWLSYFLVLLAATFGTYVIADLLHKVLRSRASFSPLPSPTMGMGLPTMGGRRTAQPAGRFATCTAPFKFIYAKWKAAENIVLTRLERVFARSDDTRVLWLEGMAWAVAGGSLAGLCLVFTKGVVKIAVLPGHPLIHPSPLVTLLLTILTAVAQIICLNKALACADTVVVVPLFYAGYTVFGFINSLVFYDQRGAYATWALCAVFISMGVLIGGVVLLSTKRVENTDATEDPVMRMTHPGPRQRSNSDGASEETAVGDVDGEPMVPKDETLWAVGEDSDSDSDDDKDADSDDEGKAQKGIGGTKESRGERGGLLLAVDDDEEYGDYHVGRSPRSARARGNSVLSSAGRRSPSPGAPGLTRVRSRSHQD